MFQTQALFPNVSEKQVPADRDTTRRENTGTQRNGELLYDSVDRSLSKRFQSQTPFNILKQFITLLTLFIYHQVVVKRTGIFFAIFSHGKEAQFSGICTHRLKGSMRV